MNIERAAAGLLLAGVLLVACAAGLAAPQSRQTLPALPERLPAPEFALRDIDGRVHRLSDYRGKVVVLNFWATWCPPCRYEMPSMERARQATRGQDIVILAINVGEDEDTIFTFTADYPVEFTLLMDPDATVVKQYPVRGLPTTYVVDPDGYVAHRAVGSREWDEPALLDELRRLLPPGQI